METSYSQRLLDLYAACQAETRPAAEVSPFSGDREQDVFSAATFIAAYLTLKAIQHLGRSPAEERHTNFDMLGVYQCFASMAFVFLTLPLRRENIEPDVVKGAVVIGKALFFELPDESCVECIESGLRKLQLIGKADQEYLVHFREDLDKATIAFVIAGTDDSSPLRPNDLVPVFAALLNILCETFSRDD
ncbi:MAG: hypothetical protein A3B82_01110 [Methylophilales bacterium RIFCSPHIGHO2_02_FULL_57_10]|nr:MAG: hypothetical protein A3B82_01110 [Methylophilales bacterium RIFCSPHIGHO2_02_FULL_57_10]